MKKNGKKAVVCCTRSFSDLVYPGVSGRLIYRPTVLGDRVPDFSVIGYKGGNVPIPDVTQWVTSDKIISISPVEGDDYPNILAAIEAIEGMDEIHRARFKDLGLGAEFSVEGNDSVIYEFVDEKLSLLQDGKLNAAIGDDEAVDWARLHLVITKGKME